MAWYKIYAGLGGEFGGANYYGTYEFNNSKEATNMAYRLAFEEYQSYEGSHGIMSWYDCLEDLIESFGFEPSEEDVDDHYQYELETWLSYYIKPATGPEDTEE